jgi:hypothetical protein
MVVISLSDSFRQVCQDVPEASETTEYRFTVLVSPCLALNGGACLASVARWAMFCLASWGRA